MQHCHATRFDWKEWGEGGGGVFRGEIRSRKLGYREEHFLTLFTGSGLTGGIKSQRGATRCMDRRQGIGARWVAALELLEVEEGKKRGGYIRGDLIPL